MERDVLQENICRAFITAKKPAGTRKKNLSARSEQLVSQSSLNPISQNKLYLRLISIADLHAGFLSFQHKHELEVDFIVKK